MAGQSNVAETSPHLGFNQISLRFFPSRGLARRPSQINLRVRPMRSNRPFQQTLIRLNSALASDPQFQVRLAKESAGGHRKR
jgi:hypothetical protein